MSVYVCVCKQNHLDGKQHTGCIPIRETVLELKAMCVHVVCVCVRVRVCVCVCKQNHLDGTQRTGCILIRETVLEIKLVSLCAFVRVRKDDQYMYIDCPLAVCCIVL